MPAAPVGDGADVIVAGSGGAGLTAALAAAAGGARVTVLERTAAVGGSTAVSGGGVWIPGNHHMAEVGVTDDREEALAYCRRLVDGRVPDELVAGFVDAGPGMIRFLEAQTRMHFRPLSWPDYYPEMEGARPSGRMLEADVYSTAGLGPWAERIRSGPALALPITLEEQSVTWQLAYTPAKFDRDTVKARAAAGQVTMGRALIAGLLEACLAAGVQIEIGARVLSLRRDGAGQAAGVRYTREPDGEEFEAPARALVLASGGFEWDLQLTRSFLAGPLTHPNTPPVGDGDGLRLAMEAGAALANMTEAWWYPATNIPGDSYEGRPLNRFVMTERTAPHSILVNQAGQRFVNEAANYNDMMKSFFHFDPTGYGWRNLPCWAVMDDQYRKRYLLGSIRPGDPDPEWLMRAATLEELAANLGVDPAGLVETVDRFNRFARAGVDDDFGRGASAYDRFHGDPTAPHPNLGTIEAAPFYSIPVYPGSVGTKGGPLTNARAQVLDVRGAVIPGFYAAGNAAASPAGPAYFGGGCSIAMALTWGYLAGTTAASLL